MKNLFKNSIITQAISLGFEFDDFTEETEIQEVEEAMAEFFTNNSEKLEQLEDECAVNSSGNNQFVNYGDFSCGGEIVRFSDHWDKSPDTKVFHSEFVMEIDGVMKNMNLYYLVGETDYNAPEGYYYSRKEKRHVEAK